MDFNKDLEALTKEDLEKMLKENKTGSKKELLEKFGFPVNYISMGIISGLLEKYGLLSEDKEIDILKISVNSKEEADKILKDAANMGIEIKESEVELNRGWIYNEDDDNEPIGETNFVIKESYLKRILPQITEEDYEDFLDSYEPETDGEKIYQMASIDSEIIEDMGEVYY